jgi:hypothetical protein
MTRRLDQVSILSTVVTRRQSFAPTNHSLEGVGPSPSGEVQINICEPQRWHHVFSSSRPWSPGGQCHPPNYDLLYKRVKRHPALNVLKTPREYTALAFSNLAAGRDDAIDVLRSSLLAESNRLFHGNGEFLIQCIERLVWRKIESVEAAGGLAGCSWEGTAEID